MSKELEKIKLNDIHKEFKFLNHDCIPNIDWEPPIFDDVIWYEGECNICHKKFEEVYTSNGIEEIKEEI